MRRDRWLIIILAVCFVLLMAVLFFWEGINGKTQRGGSNLTRSGDDFDVSPDDVEATFGGGGSGGVGDGVVSEGEGGAFVPDIAGTECGFYFEGYGVCDGTCPDGGECVSEGRSCYCKG